MEQQKKKKKYKSSWNIRPYLAMGLTAFIVLAASIVLYFFIDRYDGASELVSKIFTVLQPIVFGVIFGYLLNPLANKIEAFINKIAENEKHKNEWLKKSSRGISVSITMLLLILFIMLLLNLVVPQLMVTIEGLFRTLPRQVSEATDRAQQFIESSGKSDVLVAKLTDYIQQWVVTSLLPHGKVILSNVTDGIIGFTKGIFNFFIGIIVCIYVLLEKDHFKGIFKKMIVGIFPRKAVNRIFKVARKSDEIFGGFIVGKIVDSMIIGVLCYIGMLIFRMPYALLISVIIGVTNIIPFFGPFIGAVPSFLLILLDSPIKSLYFIIFVLVLQQLDGNIIGPKILGNSTGLSSFWVMFALLLGGGFFGFIGMLFGVPAFAVIYYIVNEIIKNRLHKKGYSGKSEDYTDLDIVSATEGLKYKDKKE